ncbi:MAG TPA: hypothetical protein VI322_00395 [Candidatus Saccharimonadia bacterium]
MVLPALNITMLIGAGLALGAVYGIVAGKQRLRILILSVYVGIVLSQQVVDPLVPYAHGLSRDQLSWVLLGVPILIFGFFGVMHAKGHNKGALIANVIVGLLTAALIISTIVSVLPPSEQANLNRDSFLAINLGQAHLWLLGLLPVVALLLGFMRSEKHG